ncbi:MAG: metal-dependent hydrolase [Aureispira sp.]|nr:metal-dependent hydrolase [Aureispira sp.]
MYMQTHNPNLPFVREDYKGNTLVKGIFSNDGDIKQVPMKSVLKWQLSKNPQGSQKKEEKKGAFRLPITKDELVFNSNKDCIVWLGHASFFIRINGVSLLLDPCLEDLPFIPRLSPKPYDYAEMKGIDYILLSHGHRDHLDLKSLKQILEYNPDAHFLAGLKTDTILKKLKIKSYQEAGWWQQYNIPEQDLKIVYLPAKHWNRRGVRDYNKTLWGSFWIESNGQRIYFAGDTAKWDHFKEINTIMGAPDIALMPIGAYKPQFIMSFAHVNPTESVEGFNQLGANTFVPMHYATYDLSNEPLSEPIVETRQLAKEGKLQGKLKELAVGEAFWY